MATSIKVFSSLKEKIINAASELKEKDFMIVMDSFYIFRRFLDEEERKHNNLFFLDLLKCDDVDCYVYQKMPW
jgi:hypothetical protein